MTIRNITLLLCSLAVVNLSAVASNVRKTPMSEEDITVAFKKCEEETLNANCAYYVMMRGCESGHERLCKTLANTLNFIYLHYGVSCLAEMSEKPAFYDANGKAEILFEWLEESEKILMDYEKFEDLLNKK
jgi:hypothetical protein